MSAYTEDLLSVVTSTTPTGVTGEPGPLPFGGEIQQVRVGGLKASDGAGVSAVIVTGYDPWVGVGGSLLAA